MDTDDSGDCSNHSSSSFRTPPAVLEYQEILSLPLYLLMLALLKQWSRGLPQLCHECKGAMG
jgi:hypothetical protein